MSQTRVAQSNERLFKVYEKNLEKPVIKDYTETAIKLAAWLSSTKAYYTAARPNIVNLLITAQTTLRQAVQHDAIDSQVPFVPANFLHHPLAPSYVRLVTAIKPFRESFTEPHLQEAVTHLLQSIEGITPEGVPLSVPHSASTKQPASSPTLENAAEETKLSGVLEGMPSPRQPASVISQGTVPVSHPQHKLQIQEQEITSQTTVLPGQSTEGTRRSPSPEIVYLGTSRKEPTESTVQKATVPSTLKTPPVDDESRPAGKNKPKKKKKKDLSAFVQSDLRDFERQQQARQRTSMDSVAFIKTEPEVEQVPTAAHDVWQNPGLALGGAQDQGFTTLLSPSYPLPVTPSRRDATGYALPTQAPASRGSFQIKILSSPTASRPPSGQATDLQSAPSAGQTLAKDTDAVPQKTQDVRPQGSGHIPPFPPALGESPAAHATGVYPTSQAVDLTHNEPSSPFMQPQREMHTEGPTVSVSQASPATVAPASDLSGYLPADALVAQGLKTLSLGSDASQRPPAERKGREVSSTGVRGSLPLVLPGIKHQVSEAHNRKTPSGSIGLTPRPLPISEDSDLGRLFKWYEEYKSTQPQVGDSAKDVEMALQTETDQINTAAGLAEDISTLDLQTQVPNKFLRVIALSPGRPSGTNHEFAFDTTDSDMRPLLTWINRSSVRLSELTSSSYCLTLGCHSALEVEKLIGNKVKASPDAIDSILTSVVQSLPSAWPQNGGLCMNVSFAGGRKDLPLSPPIVVTGDGLVDISEFMVLGRNSLQIRQEDRDFSDYIFILRVHRPTLNQLQEVVENRRKEVEWKDWLVKMTSPLKINVPERTWEPSTSG